ATFYHLLTGVTLFSGTTSAIVMQLHLTHDAKNPCDIDQNIPEAFGHIVVKMLAKAAADRYATAEELDEDLDAAHEGKAPKAAAFKGKSSCRRMNPRPRKPGESFARLTTGLRR